MQHNDCGHQPGEFKCKNCGRMVSNASFGTMNRNHCPYCLCSLHVDIHIGDRLSACRGVMEPIAVSIRSKGEWEIIHQCRACGQMRKNRIAGDDSEIMLVSLALRPIANLPFPVESLGMF